MPRLTDQARIRTILAADRLGAAYALADLEPGFFEHTSWFRAADEASPLALIYAAVHSAFTTPVLTIALNVRENNAAAKHVYERLGFQRYCGYVEAVAIKRD
jgi:hypothetical protein